MIVPFFPPMGGGGVHRPLSFVRHLPSHGWRTTVVAPDGDAYWISDPSLVDRVPGGCRVVRTRTWSGQALVARRSGPRRSTRGFGFARRAASAMLIPDSYLGWYPFARRAALAVAREDKVDAVYSTSPPETSHLVGRAVHRETRLPWVADFRDPWMNLHLLPPPSSLHARLHRRLESTVCNEASAVVVTTRWHEEQLGAGYPRARVHRVSNGYDGEEIARAGGSVPGHPFRIVHAGMLTQTRSAGPFLEALAAFLATRPDARADVRADFYGPREDANEIAARRLGLSDCVAFHDTVAHAQALALEGTAHVLLLIKHDNPRYDGLVPGKLYEYIGLARPVLAIAPRGEARELVESLRRGEAAAPTDVPAIARAIGTLYDAWKGGALESRYDLSAHPELDRAHLAAGLAAVLDEVTA